MADTAQAAIDYALKQNWKKAIELNRQIIKENPSDIEALNRLAFALTEAGVVDEAKKLYHKVLSLNRFNSIALKNLKRLDTFKPRKRKIDNGRVYPANNFSGLFVEEVGKTKVVTLINLAEAKTIANLHPTDELHLTPRRRGVAVTSPTDSYIGALPDDIASRLYILIKGGNEYEAYVKSVDQNRVSVFIREVLRKPKFRNQPSFLGKGSFYYPFVRDEALAEEEKPDVTTLEDLDEEESDKEEEEVVEEAS